MVLSTFKYDYKVSQVILVKYIDRNVMLLRLLVGKLTCYDSGPENVKNDPLVQGVALGKTNLC